MIFGGKRRKTVDIELSSSANYSPSSHHYNNIHSSSSIGYKTTASNNNELNIMPFYSTPETSTTPLNHNVNNSHTNNQTSHTLSNTSTVLSNTSTVGSSLSKLSTTTDNYISRPKKGSNRRY